MDFKSYWFAMDRAARDRFANKLGRSPAYLQLVAGGFRRASHGLATRIHEETGGDVTRNEMRPDIFGSPAASEPRRPHA